MGTIIAKATTSATSTGDAGLIMCRVFARSAPPASQGAPLSLSDVGILFFVGALLFLLLLIVLAANAAFFRARNRSRQDIERPRMIVDTSENVEALVNALRSSDWEARNEVVSALGNIGGETVVDPLINVMLHDENAGVRENAARWLGLIGNKKAVLPLIRVVKNYLAGSDAATNVAVAAAAALGDIGNTEGLAVVKKLAEALRKSDRSEPLKRVSHAVRDIELTKDLTAQKCIVCNLPLGSEEELVQCPFCKNVAHKDHMRDWLLGRDYCPACRSAIGEFSLITVQPKVSGKRPKLMGARSGRRSEKKK